MSFPDFTSDFLPDFDASAPWGPIGHVDRVNGEASRQQTTAISRFEAKMLVKHWLKEIDDIAYLWAVHGSTGSTEIRIEPYAWCRINSLVEAGLVADSEVAAMAAQLREKWPPQTPSADGPPGPGVEGAAAHSGGLRLTYPWAEHEQPAGLTKPHHDDGEPHLRLCGREEVFVPFTCPETGEVLGEAVLDGSCRDFAEHAPWYEWDEEAYTVLEVLGVSVHVNIHDLALARHLGVAVVSGGVRPGGTCPYTGRIHDGA